MKTTFTIAAIAMFAVILGMGALAPAMAAPNDNANEKAKAGKISICHVELDDPDTPEDESSVSLISVSANSAHAKKHLDDYEPFTDESGALTCDVPEEPTEPEVPVPEEA
ncbi:hypothetical protein [Nitrosopumilus sp.]|uniref:hypothetical protein n=1 Tax=Nitrosopumilus sp. TaxID=2024843 RepID=UPI00247DDB8D|nr:hypothetical protein [Nitrosopumilus sp.]MCV0430494.1 hypothetical protein [Nitrosopumilus sp.]